jgi:hypothetical protein
MPFKRGLGFWPSSYQPDFLQNAFTRMIEGAEIAMIQIDDWHEEPGNWHDKLDIFDAWLTVARKNGMELYIAFEPFNGDRTEPRAPYTIEEQHIAVSDPRWQSAYTAYIMNLVERYTPEYCNVGVEINMHYASNPTSYFEFLTFFETLYARIKHVSPQTKVFNSYQFEFLNGTFMGHQAKPQWELLTRHNLKGDVLGIASYPRFLTTPYDANSIPDDYFSVLRQHCELPIFIAEIGFYSGNDVSPKSSLIKQAQFVQRLPELLEGLTVEGVCWVSATDLHDIPALAPLKALVPHFFTLGLLTEHVEPKPSWAVWTGERLEDALSIAGSQEDAFTTPQNTQIPFMALKGFAGIGSSLRTTIKENASNTGTELLWHYTFSRDPLAMLLHLSPGIPPASTGVSFAIDAKTSTHIAVVFEETHGARYETRRAVQQGANIVNIVWRELTLTEDTEDANASFDVQDISKVIMLDLSGFFGKAGENTLTLHSIVPKMN